MKNVFVTGAAGFVGRHLIRHLGPKNYRVTALVHNAHQKKLLPPKVKVVVGDLAQRSSWQAGLKEQDVLVHLASQISAKEREQFVKNNILATQNLVLAAKSFKVKKFIHFSSAAVTSIRLDDYAKTKKEQEEILKKSKISYVFIRPSMIYGPGDIKNVGWLISFIKKMPIIPLAGGGYFGRQPVYVTDICKIVLKLIAKDYKQKIFEIHGHEYVTLRRMITSIVKKLGVRRIIVNVPIWFLTATVAIQAKILPKPKFTVDQIKSLTSGEKFTGDTWWQTFGIMPTKFEAGIAEMIDKKNLEFRN